ncbi:MAG: TonB system transport protein ExbD [Chromatiaceae bacterium]|nr:TonB system transport protein ExbD [Chromatiaceae bacterium]MCP5428984.1 TonB system transport protein ExbD [Chromatiaceae bacterium]MCP5436111.1 TonB system transport protein ExbD [Chromatiaceae bacterium]
MKPMSTMNVIPFIDIMLVLLAIVLTTATFVAQGKIPVTLPQASEAQPLQLHQPVELTVSDAGILFVDGQDVTLDDLAQRLAQLHKDTPVLLRVDEKAAFQHFVAIIDMLKAVQLKNVSIATKAPGG